MWYFELVFGVYLLEEESLYKEASLGIDDWGERGSVFCIKPKSKRSIRFRS